MELLVILGFYAIAAAITLIILAKRAIQASCDAVSVETASKELAPSHELCEQQVASALTSMGSKSYAVFNNIIIPSRGNTSHAEIDHIVISPYGIFCIETKSHRGSIYGYSDKQKWVQYLGGKSYHLMNPHRQNYKHLRALADLLGSDLKTPIHTYVVFPNAAQVKVDGNCQDYSIDKVIDAIKNHTEQHYNLQECAQILRKIKHEENKRESLRPIHNKEVQAFLTGAI